MALFEQVQAVFLDRIDGLCAYNAIALLCGDHLHPP